MYATSVFVYTPRQIVVLNTGNSVRKYMPVYAKPLSLNKGVDNQIQFQFLNQEQKPIDITDKSITCRIISYDNTEILLEKALTLTLPATGIATLDVSSSDIETIDPQKAYYSLTIPTGDFDYPVYVDQNAGARGMMEIVDSVFPSFIPSMEVTIPTGQDVPNLYPYATANSTVYTYHSSVFTTVDAALTMSIRLSGYYGNIIVQGSAIGIGDWAPITVSSAYTNFTTTLGFTVVGYYPYMRVQFNSPLGSAGNILVRS